MNNLGRGSWFLMFVILVVGMAVVVGALSVVGYDVIYNAGDEQDGTNPFLFNFSANVSLGAGETLLNYSIDDSQTNKIKLNGEILSYSDIFPWAFIDEVSGILTINSTFNNRTGLLQLPLTVTVSTSGGTVTSRNNYNFTINATNDEPTFVTTEYTHNWSTPASTNYTVTFMDEEEHYPLNFTLVNVSCDHPASTGYGANESCEVFTVTNTSGSSVEIGFNYDNSLVGTYIFNLTATEANHSCPHNYCDNSTYNVTKSVSQLVTFQVQSALEINISNCTGQTIMEGEQFNCTINITTVGSMDSVDISTHAFYKNSPSSYIYNNNRSWFLSNYTDSADNFLLQVPISITPDKNFVGNWTINFTADSGVSASIETISLYVNYTESIVTMDDIDNLNGSNALYLNSTFNVTAYDNDLLILDDSVKNETLTFASNESWVTLSSQSAELSSNASIAVFNVNHDYVIGNLVEGNYSVLINVTDNFGNTDNRTVVIEILDEDAPVWNSTLDTPVNLALTEGSLFTYNVSVNVTDDDIITFYYQNVSAQFCSLNSTNFNSTTGIINFTPTDCDVGYHNVTIVASDGNLNSSRSFNFTVSNINDNPTLNYLNLNSAGISAGNNRTISAGSSNAFDLSIIDLDFLILSGQRSFYNESLTIDVVATNTISSEVVDLFEFSYISSGVADGEVLYNASFTPLISQVGNYSIIVNITDNSSSSVTRSFFLNITESDSEPVLANISNQTNITFHDVLRFTVSATDYEDDYSGTNLTYSIYNISNLSDGAPNLTIGSTNGSVVFNMSSNASYVGVWRYNVTVTDSNSNIDWQEVYVYIYGNATLVTPGENTVFNLTEASAGILNFSINHSVGDNLTYEFWVDSINCSYQNSSNCTYGNLTLRSSIVSFGNGTAYNWSFTPNYTDETYGNLKNLIVRVYPNSTNLTTNQKNSVATNFTFKLNISHTNAPVIFYSILGIDDEEDYNVNDISLDLSDYFSDADVGDSYYNQNLRLVIFSNASSNIDANGNRLDANFSQNGWNLVFNTGYTTSEFSEIVNITIYDLNTSNNNITLTSDTSNNFQITFTKPITTVVTTPSSSSGGGSTKLKHFSLKLIAPQDVVISELGYIDIPFSIQNNGQTDLSGISLNSLVQFNNAFSNDVQISLGNNYIEELKFGESENFSMRITANTQRAGKYKATILANVTSPKFSDFADFFVEIKKANESEAEQILIFTDKFIADNPECLELTELLKQAEQAFALGEYSNSIKLANDVAEACENAIEVNEQIRYKVDGFVRENVYSVSLITLALFFIGFIFYIYKRVRFNKYEMDEYI